MLWSAKNLAKLTFPPPFFLNGFGTTSLSPWVTKPTTSPNQTSTLTGPTSKNGGFKLAVWMFRLAVPKNASKRLMGTFVIREPLNPIEAPFLHVKLEIF